MRPYRRRKAYTIVVFLALAGLIFICFQVLSIQMLNRQVRDDALKNKEDGDDCPTCNKAQKKPVQRLKSHKTLSKQQRESQKRAIARVLDDLKAKHSTPAEQRPLPPTPAEIQHNVRPIRPKEKPIRRVHQRDEVERPRGVPRHWAHLYHADSKNMFSCVDSRIKIPFSRVNDDYCDCEDGSDEPGTSACNNGRFYCEFQVTEDNLVWYPSNRVNDGLCDCCDGSDEWDSPPLPARVAAKGRKVNGENDPQPCIDRCDELLKEFEKEMAVARDGRKIKDFYIEESIGKPNPNNIYGKKGEFLPLSENCYTSHADKYTYNVCPFKEVKQNIGGYSKVIGRSPAEWINQGPKDYKLKMGHGDALQCPGQKKRISWLVFSCGIDNTVTSVQETEICEYTIKFTTPAAC